MKVRIGTVILAFIMTVILSQQPPLVSKAKEPSGFNYMVHDKLDVLPNSNLIDSIKLLTRKTDSVTNTSKIKLRVLKTEQAKLVRQVKVLDTIMATQ